MMSTAKQNPHSSQGLVILLAHRVSTQYQSHNNAVLYLSISRRTTPINASATINTSPGQCNIGTPRKKANHRAMHITGILGPSVNHSLIAATQKMPSAMVPNGIKLTFW